MVDVLRPALEDLYVRHWPKLAALRRAHPELSNPVLLSPPGAYLKQRVKLLLVGQETGPRRWCSEVRVRSVEPRRAVARLMSAYEVRSAEVDREPGHFWRGLRLFERRLGVEPGAAAWTNLNKCDFDGHAPSPALARRIATAMPVLAEEIRLLDPDVVIFLTGPTYDGQLVAQVSACIESVGLGWPLRALARLHAPGALPARSFRTFHPNFLLRFRKPLLPSLFDVLADPVRSRRSTVDLVDRDVEPRATRRRGQAPPPNRARTARRPPLP